MTMLSDRAFDDKASALLRQFYGYNSFRPNQLEIIKTAMRGRDSLVLMPTGGGKSICYQIPAMLAESGVVVVVSPLIALMNDQVAALTSNGIPAAAVHSNQSEAVNRSIMEHLISAKIKILYISPERLISDIDRWSTELPVVLFAIDEAHCVSQWGHDFRPNYVRLAILKERFPRVPVMALTATADRLTRDDIVTQLRLDNPQRFVSSFDRPNISITVMPNPGAAKRINIIMDIVRRYSDDSGIIYCLSRKTAEQLALDLSARGIRALPYHAGLSPQKRSEAQDLFINGRLQVVCATVAFGMGIDKSNIRYVIHTNMPANMESYYQEIGRAGRDGLPAEALMFYSMSDVITLRKWADESGRVQINRDKLNTMLDFAQAKVCRRRMILNYFNESSDRDCGNCDVCRKPPVRIDGTVIVQKAISAILRTSESVTTGQLVDILHGNPRADIVARGFHLIKTFGAGRELSSEIWRGYILQMVQLGLLDVSYENHNRLKVTDQGRRVIASREVVRLAEYVPSAAGNARSANKPKIAPVDQLLSDLKKLRATIASKEGIPPYIVLSDKVLVELQREQPVDIDEFSRIEGVSAVKVARYWQPFVGLIRKFKNMSAVAPTGSSQEATLILYRSGLTPAEIARERNLSVSTVYAHLTELVRKNRIDDLSRLISKGDYVRIMEAYRSNPTGYYHQLTDMPPKLPQLAVAISDLLLHRRQQ